jgi:hypothetical protein
MQERTAKALYDLVGKVSVSPSVRQSVWAAESEKKRTAEDSAFVELFFDKQNKKKEKEKKKEKKSKLCALLFSLVSKQLTMISKPRLLAIVVFNIPKQEEQLTKGGRELKISNQLNKKLFLLISINYPLSNLIIKPIEKAIN